jgi:hypothetical protein
MHRSRVISANAGIISAGSRVISADSGAASANAGAISANQGVISANSGISSSVADWFIFLPENVLLSLAFQAMMIRSASRIGSIELPDSTAAVHYVIIDMT